MPATLIPTPSGDEPRFPGYTLELMRSELLKIMRPGLMQKMMSLLPGFPRAQLVDTHFRREAGRFIGMIDAMTLAERRDPQLLDDSRRQRIAQGAGVTPQEVRALVKQFQIMKRMMDQGRGPRSNDEF